MREMYRAKAKHIISNQGGKANRVMAVGKWRRFSGAYPTHIDTGYPMSNGWHGKKRNKPGSRAHLFVYGGTAA